MSKFSKTPEPVRRVANNSNAKNALKRKPKNA